MKFREIVVIIGVCSRRGIKSTMPSSVGVLMSLQSFHHGIPLESGDEHIVLITLIGEMRIHE